MLIGQIAKITGVPVKTLRLYESVGLITPETDANGDLQFQESHIHAIKLIKMARDVGFSLREIMAVLNDQSPFNDDAVDEAIDILDERLLKLSPEDDNFQQKQQTILTLKRELEAFLLPS
ncbi:HTH-type transcriptional regulator HmrR [Thalassocella blandensis]|nr:HTH-type transcriptional regulator HmrR [Thalassocella blandensis]